MRYDVIPTYRQRMTYPWHRANMIGRCRTAAGSGVRSYRCACACRRAPRGSAGGRGDRRSASTVPAAAGYKDRAVPPAGRTGLAAGHQAAAPLHCAYSISDGLCHAKVCAKVCAKAQGYPAPSAWWRSQPTSLRGGGHMVPPLLTKKTIGLERRGKNHSIALNR